jgi:hypothetical protein
MCSILVYEAVRYVFGASHSDVLLQRGREERMRPSAMSSVLVTLMLSSTASHSDVILHLYRF